MLRVLRRLYIYLSLPEWPQTRCEACRVERVTYLNPHTCVYSLLQICCPCLYAVGLLEMRSYCCLVDWYDSVIFLVADGSSDLSKSAVCFLHCLSGLHVCFHSLLCVPSLPSHSTPVLSQKSFLPLYTPSFCLILLHVVPCTSPR